MKVFDFVEGTAPLLVSMPHCGRDLPEGMLPDLTAAAGELADTDWHVERLYDFAAGLSASVIQARFSRYLIDLNRPPDNSALYPGTSGTDLCPSHNFAGQALYRDGRQPGTQAVAHRLHTWWNPFHHQLQAELERIRAHHGRAVLFEAHTIRSVLPRLFDGRLPDLNVGTAGGESCAPALLATVEDLLASQADYTYVIDQRFKGGYITRAYGKPLQGVHALQLELAQCLYMEEQAPFHFLPEQAARLQPLLRRLLQLLIDWTP